MTNTEQEIRKELRTFVEKYAPTLSEVCTVVSVDKDKLVCRLKSLVDETQIDAVLASGVSGDCIYLPKIDSQVFVRKAENGLYYVAMFSDLESIEFFGGKQNGMVKVSEVTQKINTLEKEINQLKTLLQSWVVVPSDGGLALKTITATWASSQLVITQKADIENEKIKQ